MYIIGEIVYHLGAVEVEHSQVDVVYIYIYLNRL